MHQYLSQLTESIDSNSMDVETKICVIAIFVALPIAICLIRLIYVLPAVRRRVNLAPSHNPIEPGSSVMVLLGSGGHTGEMMRMLELVDLSQCSRVWLVSSGDTTSLKKAKNYEELLQDSSSVTTTKYMQISRARRVGEPFILSVISTLKSLCSAGSELCKVSFPDVLLVNGPGTSVPVAYLYFVLKFFGLCHTRIVYIESLARVNSLSLSGLLILPIADRFLVQWATLARRYHRAEYYGILI